MPKILKIDASPLGHVISVRSDLSKMPNSTERSLDGRKTTKCDDRFSIVCRKIRIC